MSDEQHIWQVWAQSLHRWGIAPWMAALLEGIGPAAFFGSQMVYLTEPLLQGLIPKSHLAALSHLLEKPTNYQAFIALLREGSAP